MSFKKHGADRLSAIRAFRVAPGLTPGFVSKFLEALDCPRALTVAILFREGEHDQLSELGFNPLDYCEVTHLRDSYTATKLLSKYADLSTSFDLDKVALEKFEKFESLCKNTNNRFRRLECDPKFRGPTVWLHNAVIRKISSILGGYSPQELFDSADWGPGASTLIPSLLASAVNKFQNETGITRDLFTLLQPSDDIDLLGLNYPNWSRHLKEKGYPSFQVGNKVVTVPKDASANRVIAIEPGINLWFQKAIGSMLQRRLLRRGVDLRFQSWNQKLAWVGSKTQLLATIDFSSASDSISLELVREVLPPRWFALMDSCRSHFGKQGNSFRKWEKFSSMGNGFTFQLESLIFYAMASSCMEYIQLHSQFIEDEVVSVYGDDVIIPVRCLDLFSELSDFYGFSMNVKKSHFTSCFRESCGAHFYSGIDVKPIYLKDKLSDALSVIRLANAVRRLAHRRNASYGCDAKLLRCYRHLVDSLPGFIPRIEDSLGDGGLVSNFDEAVPVRARHGVEGYFVSHVQEVSKRYQSDEFGLLLARLWVTSLQLEANSVPIRGRTRLRFTRSLVQRWKDFGPWI